MSFWYSHDQNLSNCKLREKQAFELGSKGRLIVFLTEVDVDLINFED